LRGELGSRMSFYELSFRDPWFLDRPVSFGVSAYKNEREYGDFDKKSIGFEITFGKRFWEYWAASISYNFEKATIFNIAEGASSIVTDQEGTNTTSSITLSVTKDTRDNVIDARTGSKNSAAVTFAGLGGTNAFLKMNYDSAWFFPVFEASTVQLRGRVGYAAELFNKKLPLYERFYVGGLHTVRGLGWGDAGPKDVNNEPIGGVSQLVLNAEYIFPIISEYKFKGLVFFDAGRAYDSGETFGTDLRYTTGAGIRWISPLGPIRIEWGYNIDRRDDESASKVEFSFGSFF
ncbi:MAG: BamA/TamA family outer membrane protein, partial [Nitrospirae bacterium]|nr:BamA/TamA family outer membrane protein [Nitrospirota bacterium]